MKIGVWQKGAVIILSLVLSFLFSVSLGMVSPLNRNVQNFAVDDVIGSKVTKIVNPEPTTTPIVPGQSLAVQLNITGIGSESIISQPIDIVTVIDLSRSMNDVDASGQAKLKSVKKTLNNLIDLIAQSNDQRSEENKIRLGLVSFGCGAWGVSGFCDPGKMTETKKWNDFSLDPAVLKESVESLTVANYGRNYTNMGDGLLLAGGGGKYSGDGKNYDFDGMLAQSKANESDRYLKSQKITILLSDGVQNGNIDATNKQVLDFYRNEKIPIYTIGYGLAGVTEVDAYPPMDRSVDQLACAYSPFGSGGAYYFQESVSACEATEAHFIVNSSGVSKSYCAAPSGLRFREIVSDQDEFYCLTPDIIRASGERVQWYYRLNGLAVETGGQYFFTVDNATLDNTFVNIFDTVVSDATAIEIVEKFDTNFDYQVDSFSIEGARGALTKVNTLEEILSSQQKDQYFLKIEAGLLHIFISPGTITANDNTPLVAKFSFKANAESASACIDSDVSKVKWGTWGEEETDGAFINDPIYEQILASRCYTIASPDIPSQGDIYVQNQSDLDLRASVAVVGNNITQATGEWATLKGYNFKVRTQSEKEKFSNELIGIANYLANERPNNVESLIVADSVNINVADNSGKLIIVQSVDSGGFDLNLVGSNQVGQAVGAIIIGGNANFVNVGSLKQFNGVLIVLSRDGIGGTINLNSNAMGVDSFTIRGSLVANQFNPGVNLILSQFHRTNYLNNIPGLAPILDKIYSFYSF